MLVATQAPQDLQQSCTSRCQMPVEGRRCVPQSPPTVGCLVRLVLASPPLGWSPLNVLPQDVLENESINLDWMFRYSLINDIVKVLK